MKKQWWWDDPNVGYELARLLAEGNVIAGTSDTVIGLLAPLTIAGKHMLDRIKQRHDKPYLVLVRDRHAAAVFSSTVARASLTPLLDACWPGPLTVIVPANKEVPSYICANNGTIALRVPDHAGLQRLLAKSEGLFSTSANITGEPIPVLVEEIDPTILALVAGVVDDRNKAVGVPSTIVDCTVQAIRLVREGAYSKEFLKKYITLEE